VLFFLNVDNDLRLIIPELSMASEVYNLVDSDRKKLRIFLDFIDDCKDVSSQIEYFKMKKLGEANGTDKLFFITLKSKIIGCIDLHNINQKTRKAEIGYWIHSMYSGNNIVTQAVEVLCRYSFNVLNINKLSIFADVDNIASNKVALKCNFKLVGIKVQDAVIYGEYRDMNEYYLIKSDFV